MESWKADKKQIDEVKSEDEVESEERRCNSAKVRRKKIHLRQMLEKSLHSLFFQWFVCRVSPTVSSQRRRVQSHVVRGEIKNCTPLWQELHFEVKMLKNFGVRSTFWGCDVERSQGAAVARKTFWSEFQCSSRSRNCMERQNMRYRKIECGPRSRKRDWAPTWWPTFSFLPATTSDLLKSVATSS